MLVVYALRSQMGIHHPNEGQSCNPANNGSHGGTNFMWMVWRLWLQG
ncbi:hypothetical protein [Alkalinema sp. FACHB-956]|nr:hypothetical protein [Alkalinema sp. FACHB-956]MBD2327897.1 hypothetical protein [Alkalinema sp. FACHB-956]